MDGWMDGWIDMDGWMDRHGWIDMDGHGWMDRHGWMDEGRDRHGWMDEGRDRHGWIDMDGWTWVDGWIVRGMNATNERMQAGLSRRSSVARCTKVCSCVLLFVWVDARTHGRTDARTHGRTRGRMNRGGWRPLTSSRLLRASCAKARSFAPFLRRRTRFYASCWLVVWRLAAGDW